ncbi:MAG TPA: DNA-directed RNA polymerase subunit omega [Bacillota bacterium]|nr:DNA-directed RNA polymerase subunit omega [Bacillota bacterium]
MLEPSIDSLQEKINSKYSLVSIAAKRARELKDLNNPVIEETKSNTYVGVALEEIEAKKLTIAEHEVDDE